MTRATIDGLGLIGAELARLLNRGDMSLSYFSICCPTPATAATPPNSGDAIALLRSCNIVSIFAVEVRITSDTADNLYVEG